MQSDFKEKTKQLDKIFNIKSSKKDLLQKALIHSSYTKENGISSLENYERLEFLGDAVLKLFISDILYKKFANRSEGELTKIRSIIVSDNMLAEVAIKIGLDELMILGKREEKTGGRKRKSILACTFEAVLGAYYLNGKQKELLDFLEETFTPFFEDIYEHFEKFNAKAILQEYTQSQNKEIPLYNVIEEIGPQHNKVFVVEVSYNNEILASGKGKTKREAEQAAAYEACIKLGIIDG